MNAFAKSITPADYAAQMQRLSDELQEQIQLKRDKELIHRLNGVDAPVFKRKVGRPRKETNSESPIVNNYNCH